MSWNKGRHTLVFFLALVLGSSFGYAQTVPNRFVVEGRLYDNAGSPLNPAGLVTIKFELIGLTASNSACVLYREEHTNVNISSASNPSARGIFALGLGSGTPLYSAGSLPSLFTNAAISGEGSCNPATNERLVRVSVDSGSGFETLSPDTRLSAVPSAIVAGTAADANALGGLAPSDYVKVKDDAATDLNQTNLESVFSSTNYAKLVDLLNGTSTQYLVSNPSSSLFFNDQRLTNVAAPVLSTDGATKGYTDSSIGGKSIDLAAIGPATGDGKVLMWDATDNRWEAGTPSLTDSTKLPLTGGTMAGPITLGGYDLSAAGNISISAGHSLQLGTYTNASEPVGFSTADKGKTWYNTDINAVRVWDGSAVRTQAYLDGSGKLDASWLPTLAVDGSSLTNVNAVSLQGRGVASATPNVGEVLKWNNGAWTPMADLGITAITGDVVASGSGSVSATINSNAITTVKIADDAITSGKINSVGNAINRLLITDASTGNTITYKTCAQDEVLKWDALGWTCTTVASLAPVTSVAGRTGAVTLNINDVDGWGTATLRDVGTAPGDLVELDAGGKISASVLPASVGDITSVTNGTGLSGGGSSGDVTLSVDVGTTANKIVQLDPSARLPAVDGSQLSNLNAVRLQTRAVSSTAPNDGEVLAFNNATSTWEPKAIPSGDITEVSTDTSTGLIGGNFSGAITLKIDTGITANKIVQLDGSAKLPAVDGSQLTAVNAQQLKGRSISSTTPNSKEVLSYNSSTTTWEPKSIAGLLGGQPIVQGGNSLSTDAVVGTNDSYGLHLKTSNTTRISILSGGNVGVGNTSPSFPLHVGNYAGSSSAMAQFEGYGIFRQNSPGSPSALVLTNVDGGDSGSAIEFRGNSWGTEKLAARISTVQTSGNGTLNFEVAQSDVFYPRMSIDSSGNVGIGTTSPNSQLDVSGTIRANTICDQNGTNCKTLSSGWGSGGTVTYVGIGTGLSGTAITTSGTLAVDVGTTANKIVQLDGSARLPSVDGGLLTNVNAERIRGVTVSTSGPTAGNVLRFNGTYSKWEPYMLTSSDISGAVTGVFAGTGLSSTGSIGGVTLSVNVGAAASQIVQLDASARLPNVDGGLLSNINASRLQGNPISATAPSFNQAIVWSGTEWAPANLNYLATSGGSVTGAVGIGTSNPKAILDVAASGTLSALIVPRDVTGNRPAAGYQVNGMIRYNTSTNKFEAYENGAWINMIGSASFPLTGSAGSASSPTYSYSGDTDTGWFSPGAGILAASTNQTERLRIDASGNVSIGTTSAPSPLTVYGSNTGLQLLGTSTGSTSSDGTSLAVSASRDFKILNNETADVWIGADGIERLRVKASGAVGIGTTGPRAALDIAMTGTLSALIVPRDNTSNRPFGANQIDGMIRYNTTNNKFEGFENGAWTNLISAPSQWSNNASDIYYNSGNVAIGTSNPSGLLHVQQNSDADLAIHFGNNYSTRKTQLNLSSTATNQVGISLIGNAQTWSIGQSGSKYLSFANSTTSNTPFFISNLAPNASLVIESGGKIGLGTTNPTSALDIVSVGTLSAVTVPRSDIANRPMGVNGMIRYNTDTSRFEAYENNSWKDLISRNIANITTGSPFNVSALQNNTTIAYNGSGPGVFNLPQLSTVPDGFQITITRQVPQSVTVNAYGSEILKDNLTSIDIRSRNWRSVTIGKVAGSWNFLATSEDCSIGQPCWDPGNIYLGQFNGKHYFTTPGNCTNAATPVCNNSGDTTGKPWAGGSEASAAINSTNRYDDGQTQSGSGHLTADAARYCEDMNFAGSTDWYLPARDEMQFVFRALGNTNGLSSVNYYWTSTEGSPASTTALAVQPSSNTIISLTKTNNTLVRCIRRQ